jgi:hypothetical protein
MASLGHRGRLEISIPWETWLEEISEHPVLEIRTTRSS